MSGSHCGATPTRRFIPGYRCEQHWLSVPIGEESVPHVWTAEEREAARRMAEAAEERQRQREEDERRARQRAAQGPRRGPQRRYTAPAAPVPQEAAGPSLEDRVRAAVREAAARGYGGATATELTRKLGETIIPNDVKGLLRTRHSRNGERIWAADPRV